MRASKGFTLIELMIVVVIVAILAAIALPSYSQYMRKSRRLDAKNALIALQLAQEKYRGNNTLYTTDPVALSLTTVAGATTWPSPQGYYTITISNATATDYTATASINTAGLQKADTCDGLTVNASGFPATNDACWGL